MFRFVALFVIAVLVGLGAWLGQPDPAFLARQLARTRLEPALAGVVEDAGTTPVRIALDASDGTPDAGPTPGPAPPLDEQFNRRIEWVAADTPADEVDHRLHVRFQSSSHGVTLRYALDDEPRRVHRIAWYAVLPPLLAIVAAILFRHVILCLVLGVLAGGVLAVWPTDHFPGYGLWHAFYAYFIQHALLDEFRLEIISFVLLISATVALARQSGGIQGLIEVVVRFCRTPRSARIGTTVAGLLLFFDDYLNCIVVGNTLRPLTDRHRVSRAKLAYIVDSTAAPLAGFAVFSTWIAFELSQIEEGLLAADVAIEPFDMFVRTVPLRFYCLFTLLLVFALAWTGRDYGPMLAAERRAASGTGPTDDPQAEGGGGKDARGQARYAVVPIGFTLIATLVALWWSGWQRAGRPSLQAAGAFAYLRQVLASTDSMWAFSRASALGFLLAVVMIAGGKAMPIKEIVRASFASVRVILKAVVILFLAWSIGAACQDVGTADYLVALFREVISPVGFSTVVFSLGCLVAFATGSSFSTMAILLPNVIPLAFAVGDASAFTGTTLATISVGAVLDGAIFGDHCSPISDTTILSALASRCDAIEHVRTQMPYALTAMLLAMVVGYIPVSLGLPAYISLLAGGAAVVLIVRLLGRRIQEEPPTAR